MTVFPGWWEQHRAEYMNAELPETRVFAHIEGLVGEEHALLEIPAAERTHEEHERLRSIGAELDRVFEKLRERAGRLTHGRPAPGSG